MGQQFYVIRRNPAPGTPAFDAKLKRDRAKGKVTEVAEEEALEDAVEHPTEQRQRQQPKKLTREQRRRQAQQRPPRSESDGPDDIEEGKPA
jgi:YidC/Oxa1 family membrane protein insertase